jgi:hypothetical protein
MMVSCEQDSNRFINIGDTDMQTLHDFDKFFQKKMLLELLTFFYTLALSSGETVTAVGVQLTRHGSGGKTVQFA